MDLTTCIEKQEQEKTIELVFTNNHELISNLYIECSKLTDHKYVICETSHQTTIDSQMTEMPVESNLATYNYERTNWKDLKAKFQLLNWNEILSKYNSSAEKLEVILSIVSKEVDECSIKFNQQKGSSIKNIPRDRRILLRNKKKLKLKLKKEKLSKNRKEQLEQACHDPDIPAFS